VLRTLLSLWSQRPFSQFEALKDIFIHWCDRRPTLYEQIRDAVGVAKMAAEVEDAERSWAGLDNPNRLCRRRVPMIP
jgi:hypothetical protein